MPLISEVVNWRGRVSLISEAVWRGEGVSYFRGSEGRGWVSLISEAPYPHALHPVLCAPVQHTYASVPVHHAPSNHELLTVRGGDCRASKKMFRDLLPPYCA